MQYRKDNRIKTRRVLPSIIILAIVFTLTGCMFGTNQPSAGSSQNIGNGALTPKLPDPDKLQYYDTLEEAVAHNMIETSNVTHIDEKIKLFENDQDAVLFFRSNTYDRDVLYVFKFYVREINGTPHYSPPILGTNFMWAAQKLAVQKMKLDAIGEVRLCISMDSLRQFRVDNSQNFFWGISQSPKAKNLKIEGQPATQVIPVKMDGDTAYFWYFDDLKTNKKPVFQDIQKYVKGDFVITMD